MTPKIDSEDLIDASEVAELLGLAHRNAVSLYQRRYEDMPRPLVIKGAGKIMLWSRKEVATWAKKTGRRD